MSSWALWLEWRRDDWVRWDRDVLTIATEALIAAERAKGTIFAWSNGELACRPGSSRPKAVAQPFDTAFYGLKSLSILFPETRTFIDALQADLVQLADLTWDFISRSGGADDTYRKQAEPFRSRIDEQGAQLLTLVQAKLQLTRTVKFRGYSITHTHPRSESSSS